jgi:propionate CoA-transferase
VHYVTERCVFRLIDGGLELIEIAPGVDLQRDLLAQMDFEPAISPTLKAMDRRLFGADTLGLRERLLTVPMSQRVELRSASGQLFINFEGLRIDDAADLDEIERTVTAVVAPLGRRVEVVVNYDHFSIRPELMDAYSAMVGRLQRQHYSHVTRYAASGFVKARLAGG